MKAGKAEKAAVNALMALLNVWKHFFSSRCHGRCMKGIQHKEQSSQ
jgi:hypothetical protein